jgi:signal transduction histidine kinase
MAIIKFSDILASSIHDIKNALSMVTSTIEQLTCDPEFGLADNPRIMHLQLEARRVNHDLIQLLMLYRYENEKLKPNLTENDLEDFIEEIAIENRALSEARGIRIATRCDPLLVGYFDENLARIVINNAFNNAQRHTRDKILLSVDQSQDYLRFCIEDNGDGFPETMLTPRAELDSAVQIEQGRTQLGLYFSNLIAQIHTNGNRRGFIRLENRVNLSGGCFSLWLP